MSYGIVYRKSRYEKLLYVPKKIIRIMAHAKRKVCFIKLICDFNILSLCSEFLLSVLSFVLDIMEIFQRNSDMHGKQKAKIQPTCAKN